MVSSNMPRKTKIFVGRLPENCRNDELRQLFLRFGEVTECDVMNRYAFVHMAREEDAASAIKALHNSNFKGATINVEQSTGMSRGGGPAGSGGRRDNRRAGPMRGGRGGRDGGRDVRPGPYNDRRVDYNSGGVVSGGYADYGRGGGGGGGGDYSGRTSGYDTGYADSRGYNQSVGQSSMGGYSSTASMGGGYGPASGTVGGYGTAAADYGRTADYGRPADYGARTDYGTTAYAPVSSDYSRSAPVDYGRTDSYGSGRAVDYNTSRNDYDRGSAGPMRNGGSVAASGYGTGYSDVGYGPISGGPSYSTGGPSYSTGGPQADMYSRRAGGAVASGGYPPVSGGYADGYDRADPYGPPRTSSRSTPG
ncbi:RNA-binding protein 4.1-like isoform X2 [Venturia canescens]|uniref:RNA-binding protein 4.1-like isoform X2 n=1 Tax=Venturia canescens TaxID=32260 RepID=UPI001C9C79E4|nr:RNA-binding protein 4.1-like isoform X2 [Venturia canescens]